MNNDAPPAGSADDMQRYWMEYGAQWATYCAALGVVPGAPGAAAPGPAAAAISHSRPPAEAVPPPAVTASSRRPKQVAQKGGEEEKGKTKRFVMEEAGQKWEDPSLAEWPENDFRIFVGDIGNDCTDDMLREAFSRYPSFQKAKVVLEKKSGKIRGYGFVSFSDPVDFTKALREMNGQYVGSRPMKLSKSRWQDRLASLKRDGRDASQPLPPLATKKPRRK